MARLGRFLRSLAWNTLPPVALLISWQLTSSRLGRNRFPGIFEILNEFWHSAWHHAVIEAQGGGAGGYLPHVRATAGAYVVGFLAGACFGGCFALLVAQNRVLRLTVEPLMEFSRALPPLLFIPFSLLIIQDSEWAEVVAIGCSAAFGIMVYTLSALLGIPRNYMELSGLLGATRWGTVRHVQIPAILPELVGAARVTSVLCLGVAVVTEYLAVPRGIGRVIKYAISFSDLNLIWAGILWSILLGVTVDSVIVLGSRLMLRWTTREQQPFLRTTQSEADTV